MKAGMTKGISFGWRVVILAVVLVVCQVWFVSPVLAAPAIDGDGQVTVSPTNVPYGSGAGTFTFTFTANNGRDFVPGSQVQIIVPAGWTAPKLAAGAGHISWFPGAGCTLSGSPPVAINAMTIIVDIDSCTAGNSFTLTYASVTPGPVSITPYTFAALTDIGPGGAGLVPTTAPAPTISVDPGELTVTGITTDAKVYDGTTGATVNFGSASLVGVVSPDVVNLETSGYSANFDTKHAGNGKPVAISGLTLSGAGAANYVLVQPGSTGNITRRALAVTAVTDSKVYDGTVASTGLPVLTTGTLAIGDSAAWSQTYNNRNIGTNNKVLTPAGVVNDGNAGNNYTYTYHSVSTGTITKRPITVVAESDTKIYDGTTSSTGLPLLASGSIAAGDSAPAWTQTFNNKNVGTGKVLTPAGLVNDGNGGNNYAYTYTPDTTGVIDPKPLTVSSSGLTPANKTYDGTTAASLTIGTPGLVGVVSPDVVTLVTSGAAGEFADRNAGTGKTVHISGLTLGGAGAGNYTLTQPTRTANITKRTVRINAVSDTKTYDGTTSSGGLPTLSANTPLAAGDSEPAWTQTFNNRNAGTNKVLTPAGLVNDGNGGLNYTYNYATVSTGTIDKLPITVTAVGDSKPYDGLVTSSGLPVLSGATPLAAGDVEPVWTQTFANRHAGTGKTLNPAGLVVDGNGGNNYAYTFIPDVSGVITPRSITVTAVTDTKTYDGTTTSAAAPNIDPALVGTDTSAFLQTFDTPAAGTGKTLTPSGTVNDGNNGLNYAITFAPPIQTGVIEKANPALTVTNSPVLYNGQPQAAVVSAGSVAGTVNNILYNGTSSLPVKAGTYAITADFTSSNPNYNDLAGAQAGSFVIRKDRVLNGGFNTYTGTSRIPKSWTAANFASTDGKDTTVKKEGTASLKLAGQPGKTKTLSQTMVLNGVLDDPLSFSFWVKGSALPAAGLCRAQVFLYNGTTLVQTKTINCPSGTYGFQLKTLDFKAKAAYTKAVITITYARSTGTVWFDSVKLLK